MTQGYNDNSLPHTFVSVGTVEIQSDRGTKGDHIISLPETLLAMRPRWRGEMLNQVLALPVLNLIRWVNEVERKGEDYLAAYYAH